jgi:Spy/CpxP family protein refolding chaperone
MKKTFFLTILFPAAIAIAAVQAIGQDIPPQGPPTQDMRPQGDERPNLLRQLGLTPEQIDQIRRWNQERKPLRDAAARRLREANRNLDMAIYGETVNEGEFQARLKEFHEAQVEMSRIRFTDELAVRKVLTAEQLVRFRELRRRFAEARDNLQNRDPRRRDQPPLRRLDRRNVPQDSPPARPANLQQRPKRTV